MEPNRDEVLFSLAPNSPTLIATGKSAADIFYSTFNGTYSVFAPASALGLLSIDNVDAADIAPAPDPAQRLATYTLTLTVKNPQMGNVDVDPNLSEYPEGTEVTLTAEPNEGKKFTKWKIWDPNYPDGSRSVIDTNDVLYLTMDGDYVVKAFFKCGGGAMAPLLLGVLGLWALVRRRA